MKHLKELIKYQRGKLFIPLFICGLFGLLLEVFMRALGGALVGHILGVDEIKYLSMVGWTSLWMTFVYFVGFGEILLLNEMEKYYKLPMWFQTIFGGFLIGLTELISGIILNLSPLNLNIWYYKYLSILHQVTLSNYILFTLAIPFAIWFIDFVDGTLNKRPELIYHVLKNYKDLFTGK